MLNEEKFFEWRMLTETEDKRRKTGGGRRKMGDRRREAEDGRRKTGGGRRETKDGRWGRETGDERRKTEDGRRQPVKEARRCGLKAYLFLYLGGERFDIGFCAWFIC